MENAMADSSAINYPTEGFSIYDGEDRLSDNLSDVNLNTVVGIPAYNEENTIASVVLKAKKYADEVVVVDDGSIDETVELAREAGARVIKHEKNKGYGASLRTLIHYAREKDTGVLVLLDGDGQHPEHEIPNLTEKIVKGEADVTIGSRFLDPEDTKSIPLYRRFGIKLLTRLSTNNMSYTDSNGDVKRITDGQSGFRAFSRRALEKVNPKEIGMGASAEILMEAQRAGLYIEEIPISVSYEGDTSTENPIRHGLGVIGSIIRYTETKHSLLSFGVPGLIAFLLGVFLGIRTILIYNNTGIWPIGHVFATVLLFFGGLALGMTGLILHAIINAHKRGFD
ncbi:MAG: glycosyltransferase family 2 protein [Thermoplasmatota archaeon]